MPAKLTQEQVIEKFQARHGDRYDYSRVVYTRCNSKVVIVCPEHGEFQITPSGLLSGKGCGQCGKKTSARKRTKTTEQFVSEATTLHEGRYSYPRAIYTGQGMPIIITCSEHGDFTQTPNGHLAQKAGCPVCAVTARSGVRLPQEEFILRCVATHGERYDYSKTVFCGSRAKVTIGCPEHGWFDQRPYDHVYGSGCPQCAYEESAAKRTYTQETYLAAAKKAHGDRYDYSNTVYVAAQKRCEVVCRIHGPFMSLPSEHTQGRKSGCPKCGVESRGAIRSALTGYVMTKVELQSRLDDIYGPIYTALSDGCNRSADMLTCTCAHHGEFSRPAVEVLKSSGEKGCPKCGYARGAATKEIPADEFFARCSEAHAQAYDYSSTVYSGRMGRIAVTCPTHGPFSAHAGTHMYGGSRCPQCMHVSLRATTEEFVEKARNVHGDTYDYGSVGYTGAHDPVTITCRTHGDFETIAYFHTNGSGVCPKCGSGTSKQEVDVGAFLEGQTPGWKFRAKRIIPPQELDIYHPQKKLAVEFCGIYWHSEEYLASTYHLEKLQAAEAKGIRLITLFEDEWLAKKPVVKALLGRICGTADLLSLGARACTSAAIQSKDAAAFYLEHHLQGPAPAETHIGLFYADELVAAASFAKPRVFYGGTPAEGEIELVRFSQHSKVSVSGALGKLCSLYAKHNPSATSLISYVDRRWFTGSSYLASGFVLEKITAPGYSYAKAQRRYSRYRFAKHRLGELLPKYDAALSERDNMLNNNYRRIYDCGQLKLRKTL